MLRLFVVLCALCLLQGCATSTGLDKKIVWDAQCRAFFVASYGPLQLADRAVDADKVLINGKCERPA